MGWEKSTAKACRGGCVEYGDSSQEGYGFPELGAQLSSLLHQRPLVATMGLGVSWGTSHIPPPPPQAKQP